MQDHRFEEPDEEREREAVDALAEHETFLHHRGDDRACEELRSHLELFALGAALPSVTTLPPERRRDTNTRANACGTRAGHTPPPPAPGAVVASGDAGDITERREAA